jgi:hypothetical protein
METVLFSHPQIGFAWRVFMSKSVFWKIENEIVIEKVFQWIFQKFPAF